MANIGKITQIIGAVLDIKFTGGNLPEINEAITIKTNGDKNLTVEVAQHLGDDTREVFSSEDRRWCRHQHT